MEIWKALKHLYPQADPQADYEIRDDGAEPYIAAWRLAGNPPTESELMAAITAYDGAAQLARTDALALRQTILTTARTAEGVLLANLTTNQIKALLAILLWKEGGVKPDMTVRALAEWIV